jgi:Raf kinase inhibitor-like YbhB/YbcL family protein
VGIVLAGWLTNAVGADSNFMTISSPDFAQGSPMAKTFAYKGDNHSPQLLIGGIPLNAKTLALIVDDPDSPSGLWTHWLMWNLPRDTAVIAQGEVPKGAVQGRNSFGHVRYDGPAPPSGTHRYFFHVYALDTRLSLAPGASRTELEAAMKGHVVGSAEFFGIYSAAP